MAEIFRKRKKNNSDNSKSQGEEELRIPGRLLDCEKILRDKLGNSSDVVISTFETPADQAMLFYIEGLVNRDSIEKNIISPLKSPGFDGNIAFSFDAVFSVSRDIHEIIEKVLSGYAALFYGSSGKGFIFDMKGWAHRAIEEPIAEAVIRGPKEGFIEDLQTNTALIRRKIKTPELRFEKMYVGRQTRTAVMLVYINGIVNQDILNDLRARIKGISVDRILETGEIEQFIDKNTFSSVSGMGVTQKPDILAIRILEGRVAVLVDGTPHALTVPEMFMDNFKTAEDYYENTVYVNVFRILRGISLFITAVVPGLAIAVFTYNQEMLPSVFLTSLISSSIRTPMPFSFEILLLIVLFELIKEGGTRLPKTIGSAVTIVGSLIVGEAAVNAGIVSAPSVIIVATAALASFVIPSLSVFVLVYRALFWFLGSIMGMIGIGAGFVIMITQLASEESFGRPILSSFSKNEMKDSLFRFPLKDLKYRPTSIARENVKRQR